MLKAIADGFEEFCNRPDPRPGLVQEARGHNRATAEAKIAEAALERPSGADLARRAVDEGKAQANDWRLALGAQALASKDSSVTFRLLNSAAPEEAASPQTTASLPAQVSSQVSSASDAKAPVAKAKAQASPSAAAKAQTSQPPFQTASVAGMAKPHLPTTPAHKCRVWTASYGGQKALIIKSVVDKVVNYTVLDVNAGAEKREADAFISAYAKEGVIAGEFVSQAQALDKAFELCPEG
jgi:hypothetical protein